MPLSDLSNIKMTGEEVLKFPPLIKSVYRLTFGVCPWTRIKLGPKLTPLYETSPRYLRPYICCLNTKKVSHVLTNR